jgi:mRNA interferase YafQ
MREIERSNRFKRDYKRELKGLYRSTLADDLARVVHALAADMSLEPRYRDHPLRGSFAGYRDCHIRPDLVLIYAKPDADTLQLVRLGSHSELFE